MAKGPVRVLVTGAAGAALYNMDFLFAQMPGLGYLLGAAVPRKDSLLA